MGSLTIRTDQRQQHALSPRLQHAVRLLQLSSQEFAQQVRAALGNNPFLDVDDGDGAEPPPAADAAVAPETGPGDEPAFDVAGGLGEDAGDREVWYADGFQPAQRGGDVDDLDALDRVAGETSLSTHLHEQLAGLPPREAALAGVIVGSLDDDGYLRSDLADLLGLCALSPPATIDELEQALRRVQALEPAGVAARSVAECLLLQLPAIACPDERALAGRIVGEHLQRLAAKDVNALSRALARTPAEIERVCGRIRRLDPRPGWRFGSTRIDYIVPDVIVRKHRGAWTVRLNPAILPKVKLNGLYAELFQRQHRQAHNQALAGHLKEARWTLSNIEQRFSTILGVAQAIVRRQQHFLEFGAMAMKPLGLREIADELGMHESTVSRVTNNKYIATPTGVYELKHFFSRALVTASGSACSGTAIRGLVAQIIAAEAPQAPLSDVAITRQLTRQGLTVARRTVTKYRQQLRIEPVERRRRRA